jgi:ABC-type sugar transport system ATPase subunit
MDEPLSNLDAKLRNTENRNQIAPERSEANTLHYT